MFKKIEIWILYLVIFLGAPFALSFGVLVRQELEGMTKSGIVDISFLTKPALSIARIPEQFIHSFLKRNPLIVNDSWDENRNFYNQEGFNGIPNLKESYLLLSRYDGDLEEGIVELVDLMNFKVLHTWNPDINKFNKEIEKGDEFKTITRDHNNFRTLLFHPKLTQDGGLLFSSSPLRKIDACSNLIFQNQDDIFHHSLETDIDGNIWVPSRMYPQFLPIEKVGRDIPSEQGYLDDAIVKLSPDGEILYEKSVSQIFIENDLGYLLFAVGDRLFTKDPIHLNDIQPVDFDGKFWKKGDVFLSLRHQSMVLLFRPNTNEIVWKWTGPFYHQHDVDIVDESRISVFNNNSKDFVDGDIVDGHNEVIIYDFKTNEYYSYLSDSLIKNDVRTITGGRNQILSNGDLFVVESNYGRTLYFDSDGSLRWEHVNRSKSGKVHRVAWSRILYSSSDIQIVKNFLQLKDKCND